MTRFQGLPTCNPGPIRGRSVESRGELRLEAVSLPLACGLLCLGIGLAYAPATGFGFLSVDDQTFVLRNPMVNQGLRSEGVWLAFSAVHSSNWIPLTWLSHALDVSAFGLEPGAHHSVNVLLHALNTSLVFLALRRMTAPEHFWRCAVVAGLFALHPARVETVAWVSERKGLLSSTFWWLAILAYERHTRRPSAGRLAVVGSAMALGLLAKGMLVTLPFALLLVDAWPLRRLSPGTSARRSARVIAEKLPLIALSVAAAVVTLWAQSRGPALQGLAAVPIGERAANAVLAYARYLGILVWPVDLSPFYPRLSGDALAWLGPSGAAAALLLGISALTVRLAQLRPYLLFGWLWYLVTLFPVIGLVQVGAQSIADRYTYLPYFGLFVAGVWGVADLYRAPGRGPLLTAAAAIALLACGALTRVELRPWSSSLAFWERAVAVSPGVIARAQFSDKLLAANRLDEALAHARFAVEMDGGSVQARHVLGAALLRQGKTAAAGSEFFRAIQIDPEFAPSQLMLAWVRHDQGGYRAAADLFEQALTREPQYAETGETRERYAESLRRELTSGQAGFEEAVEDHRRALALRPDWVDVRQNLAWILATSPLATAEHGREAVVHARRVTDAGGRSGPELGTLAAAHAAAGDFAQAIAVATEELAQAEAAGYTLVAQSIRTRLKLYRSGRPYREPPTASSRR